MTYKKFLAQYETLMDMDQKKCKKFVNDTYRLLKNSQGSLHLSVLYRKAYFCYLEGDFKKAVIALEKVMMEGTKYPFFPEYAYAFNLLGIINMLQNNQVEAKVFYQEALSYAKKHRMKKLKSMIYSNLAVVEAYLGRYDECIQDLLLAIQLSLETDHSNLGRHYYNLSRNYIEVKKPKEAQDALNKCLIYQQNEFDDIYIVFLKKGIAELNNQENQVKAFVDQIYNFYEKRSIIGQDIDSCFTLCNDCYRFKEYDKLINILEKLQEYSRKNHRVDIDLFTNELQSKLATERGDLIAANEYLRELVDLYQQLRKNDEYEIQEKINTRLKVAKLTNEVKDKMKQNRNLEEESLTDALTRLENRRALDQLLKKIRGNSSLGCLMLDVDNFKFFNDTYGHDQGDFVLKQIGEVLLSFRQNNVRVFRYGGDEFILIGQKLVRQELQELASQIKEKVNRIQIRDNEQGVGITIGIYYQNNSKDITKVVSLADEALIKGKEKKNVIFELKED